MVQKMNPRLEIMKYGLKFDTWEEIDCPPEERELIGFSYDSVLINMNLTLNWLIWLPFQQNTRFPFSFLIFLVRSLCYLISQQRSKDQRRRTYLQVLNGSCALVWSLGLVLISGFDDIDLYYSLKMANNSYWKRILVWNQNFSSMV